MINFRNINKVNKLTPFRMVITFSGHKEGYHPLVTDLVDIWVGEAD